MSPVSPVSPGRYSSYCANQRCRRGADGEPEPRPVYGTEVICDRCTDRVEYQLAEVARVHDELEGVLAAASASARFDTGSVSGSKTPPVPVRLEVTDHRDHIRHLLVSWTRLVIEERGLTEWPDNTLDAIAEFLRNQVEWLARHDAAGDLCNELSTALGRANGLLAGQGPVCWLPCPDTDEQGCEGRIRVTPETTVARCRDCGWETDDLPWLGQLLRGGQPALVTATDACHQLRADGRRLRPATIRKWVERGKITVHGRDTAGRSLYDLDEITAQLPPLATTAA